MNSRGNPRLYALIRPAENDIRRLAGLQTSFNTDARATPPEQLHVTLLHIGRVRDIYKDIARTGSPDWSGYVRNLHRLIWRMQAIIPQKPLSLPVTGWELYGPDRTVLALQMEPDSYLSNIHNQLYDALRVFLYECGISDIDTFIGSSRNLHHASQLNVHLTLLRHWRHRLPDHKPDIHRITFQPGELSWSPAEPL